MVSGRPGRRALHFRGLGFALQGIRLFTLGDSILYPRDAVLSWRTRLCTVETRFRLGLGGLGCLPEEFGYVTEVLAFVPIALWDPELLPPSRQVLDCCQPSQLRF